MTVPASVSKQAKLAEEIQNQLANPSEEGARHEEHKPQIQEEETPGAQATEPAPAAQEPAPFTPEPQPAPPSPEEDYLYWKNRFQVIQGKYNAEVPALRKQVTELEQSLSEAITQQAKPDNQSAHEQVVNALDGLSQDEVDEFGPELVGLIQRIVGTQAEQSTNKLNSLNEQLTTTQDELTQIKDERAEQNTATFWASVQRQVPDLLALNSNPDFLNWLDGMDEATGMQRQSILSSHQERLNANGVAALFNAFKQTVAKPQERETPPELPSKSNASESTHQAESTRIWLRSEISEFYRDAAQGKYKPEQKEAIEKEIFDARNSGRVR